jgi:hypothetical protein
MTGCRAWTRHLGQERLRPPWRSLTPSSAPRCPANRVQRPLRKRLNRRPYGRKGDLKPEKSSGYPAVLLRLGSAAVAGGAVPSQGEPFGRGQGRAGFSMGLVGRHPNGRPSATDVARSAVGSPHSRRLPLSRHLPVPIVDGRVTEHNEIRVQLWTPRSCVSELHVGRFSRKPVVWASSAFLVDPTVRTAACSCSSLLKESSYRNRR